MKKIIKKLTLLAMIMLLIQGVFIVNTKIKAAGVTHVRVDLGGGKAAIEGSIMRAMMPISPVSLRVGVFSSNTEWAESGCLPKHTLNEDGSTTPSALLDVKLN